MKQKQEKKQQKKQEKKQEKKEILNLNLEIPGPPHLNPLAEEIKNAGRHLIRCSKCHRMSKVWNNDVNDFKCIYAHLGCDKLPEGNKGGFWKIRLNGRR